MAQAQAEGPQLVPGATGPESADPVDYSVAADGTIRVVAAETLGHYADWLGTSAARLRALNHLHGRTPVVMGRRIKLEFATSRTMQFEAAPARLPRAAAGGLFRIAPHRGHRGLHCAARRFALEHHAEGPEGAGVAAAAVQPGPGFQGFAARHADLAAQSGGCLGVVNPARSRLKYRRAYNLRQCESAALIVSVLLLLAGGCYGDSAGRSRQPGRGQRGGCAGGCRERWRLEPGSRPSTGDAAVPAARCRSPMRSWCASPSAGST